MLSTTDNARLTRVGPGTPGGELLRRYWQPFLPAALLDRHPVQKVRLLGEDLVCYRDRTGTVGLIGDRCAHRLVGMHFGIPDERGLRCPYHGWCYSETGQCIDTPLESPRSRLKERVKLTAYPVRELGGLLFAYLGPAPAPILPPWDLLVWPNAVRQIGYTIMPCNWLQCHENSYDPAHTVYLHGYGFQYQLERKGELASADRERHPAFYYTTRYADGFEHVTTKRDQYGVQQAMVFSKARGAASDWERWTLYTAFPQLTRPSQAVGPRHIFLFSVPIDDSHTYQINYEVYVAPPGVTAPEQPSVPYFEISMPFGDGFGEVPLLDTIRKQDYLVWASQGAVADRSKETLGATDKAVREYRELLDEQIELVQAGKDPLNVFRDPAETGACIDLDHPVRHWWERVTGTDGQVDYKVLYDEARSFLDQARVQRGLDGGLDSDQMLPLAAQIVGEIARLAGIEG